VRKEHSLGVFEREFTSGYSGVGGCIADSLPGVVLEIARCCCSECSHDSRFVPIVSGNALWLCECFGFRERILAAGMRLGFRSVDPPEGET